MATVLIVSNIRVFDAAGMATGPGLRAWGLAAALVARGHRTTLAAPRCGQEARPRGARDDVSIVEWTPGTRDLKKLLASADVVIAQPGVGIAAAFSGLDRRCLVVDLYNPVVPEQMAVMAPSELNLKQFEWILRSYRYFLARGDFFLCAGERQRLFTLGALAHAGRLNPLTDLNDLLRLVPMGVESAPPPAQHTERLLRGRVVPADSELLLWPGGIYGWFEAVTAIRALALLRRTRPRAVMAFVGAENPLDPSASQIGVASARAAARELGLLESGVYFAPWLPYEARAAMYQESELAVLTHRPLLEAQLSWRTRSLDCLWGGLPLVVTTGDEVGEIAERAGAAFCVPPEDPEALAAALNALLADPARRAAMAGAARRLAVERWSWERVTEPLHQICLDPRPAPDRRVERRLGVGQSAQLSRPFLARRLAGRLVGPLRRGLSRRDGAPGGTGYPGATRSRG
jgi:glycosyltransferase involved in cell wall biosynthesis